MAMWQDIADALRVARLAIAVGKDEPDALWMGGHTLSLLAGDHATAMSAIEQSITINPNGAFAWWAKGSVNLLCKPPRCRYRGCAASDKA